MRDFGARRWPGPAGARVHVLALPDKTVRDLASNYDSILRRWTSLRMVPADRLHLTLTWVPAPIAAQVTDTQYRDLEEALCVALASVAPPLVSVGPVDVTAYGVRLNVGPDSALVEIGAAVRRAALLVLGPDAVPEPARALTAHAQPHIALAYGVADTPEDDGIELFTQLRAVRGPRENRSGATLQIDDVTITDADNFGSDPWVWIRQRSVPVGSGLSGRAPDHGR